MNVPPNLADPKAEEQFYRNTSETFSFRGDSFGLVQKDY